MVKPDTVDECECHTVAIWVHRSCHQDIGVILLVFCDELLPNHTFMRIQIEYANRIRMFLHEQDKWFGLAYGHTLVAELPNICLANFKTKGRLVMAADLLLADIVHLARNIG